jgi:hypothetical protein
MSLSLSRLGLLWKNSDGYTSSISFFFASFVVTCVWVIEIVPGLHEEKVIFYRERAALATTTFATWFSMGLPMLFMSLIICVAFTLPAYFLSGLRTGVTHYLVYFSVLYLGVIVHILMQYLTAGITPNPMIHTLIFPGLIIPFEVDPPSIPFLSPTFFSSPLSGTLLWLCGKYQ